MNFSCSYNTLEAKVSNILVYFYTCTLKLKRKDIRYTYIVFDNFTEDSYKVMPQNCTAIKGYNVDVSRLNKAGNNEKITLWDHST